MSEQWPPDWEDLDAENQEDDDQDATGPGLVHPDLLAGQLTEQLAEVTAALASMPRPALPDAFAARISAAISAEAATRTELGGAADESATARSLSADDADRAPAGGETTTAPPDSSRPARRRRGAGRQAASPAGARPPGRGRRLSRPLRAIGSLAVCLVIVGFGFLIFHNGAPSEFTHSTAAGSAASAASPFRGPIASANHASRPLNNQQSAAASSSPGFAVRETGTRYEPATLAGQARAATSARSATSVPSALGAGTAPSPALEGCVYHLTGGQQPSLVDRASYAGRPAYIIAVPHRAWVVGLGCTAAHPELIRSVALAG